MSVTDQDLLTYGESLSNATSEIEWRNSIGRSYYASFHCADAWHKALSSQGCAAAGRGIHATLIESLQNPTVTGATMMRSKSLGYMLGHMKPSRNKADYRLCETVDQSEAETIACMSRTLIEKAI